MRPNPISWSVSPSFLQETTLVVASFQDRWGVRWKVGVELANDVIEDVPVLEFVWLNFKAWRERRYDGQPFWKVMDGWRKDGKLFTNGRWA